MNLADLSKAQALADRLEEIEDAAQEINGKPRVRIAVSVLGAADPEPAVSIDIPGDMARALIRQLRDETIKELGALGVYMPPLVAAEPAPIEPAPPADAPAAEPVPEMPF